MEELLFSFVLKPNSWENYTLLIDGVADRWPAPATISRADFASCDDAAILDGCIRATSRQRWLRDTRRDRTIGRGQKGKCNY